MASFASNILTKCYWPLVVIYCIILCICIFLYFSEINNWSNRAHYNWMNIKRIGITAVFLLSSLLVRHLGDQKWANIILYIPVGFSLLILLGSLFMLLLFMINTK